jgi:putative transposase
MNPIEQIWAWIRLHGFNNEHFQTLEKVVDRLCDTILTLTNGLVKSVGGREWILSTF